MYEPPFISTSPWNTPIDKADTTYSDPDSIQNQQFRDTSLANTWIQDDTLRFYSSSSDPVATWTYDTLNDHGTFLSNGSPQIQTPSDLTFFHGSDGFGMLSDSNGHYYDVWEGSYEHPFISTSPWNTPIDKAQTTYSDPDSIQNQQFRDTSLANTWIQDDTPRFYSSSSDPVATWTYDTLNDHGTFLSNGSPQIQTPSDLTFFHGSDGFGMLSDSNGHYYDVWEGSYEHPFISTSPWNTPIDKAQTTYSDPDSIQNQQFRDTSLANTWIQDDTLRFYSSSSDPVATWTYDTLNDHGTFLSNGSLQIETPSDMTFFHGSDALGMLSDSNGHYYDVWEGSYEHPFISTSPWNTPIDKAHTTYSDLDSIQNQQFRDTSLANTWIQDDTPRFYSSSSDPVATWTYDTLNDHGTFLSNGSLQIQTPSDMTFSGGSDALGMLSDSNGHYYDVWEGSYEHPFISTSPWNTPIDKAHTTYSDLDSIQNQQFRDTSLANTWIQDDTLRFYSSSSDPVATWTYDTLNDHGTFLSNGSLQIQTPSDMTFSGGSDALGMLSDSNGHYYDVWEGSYEHPFISTSPWNTPIDKAHTTYSDLDSIQNQQFRDTSLANTWIQDDTLRFYSSSSDPVATWTYDTLNDHGTFLSNGSLQIQTPSDMTFSGGSDALGMLSDSNGHYYDVWEGSYEHPFISTSPWNTPIDKAHTTYSDLDSIQNQQFRDTSLANTWIQDDTLRFYSSSSDPVATWTYDTLNDHGTFLSNGSLQIQTPSDMTFSGGSDALGMLSDSNGHYYDVWEGSYEHPFISTSPWNTPIDKAHTTYSDPDSIQNQQFRDTSLANTWIHNDTLRFYSSSSDPVATWTYDTLNDHGTFLSNGSLQIQTPSDMTFSGGSDALGMLSDSNGHYYDVWEGSYEHPFISTSP